MTYTNPILKGDYSDPDVIRVGTDYYMIASSFTYLPGIPVLTSKDLVSWRQIGNAAYRLPLAAYDKPMHKNGTWAPSIRFHNGLFYVYMCMPDDGLFCFTAQDPAGAWEAHYVKDVCGWIDPCPLFDGDEVYLVHGFAASRCGINNLLYIHRLSADGLSVLDKGRLVYDGFNFGDTTVEGPKLYKRSGYYYIFCPAGGVEAGYQLALRSKNIYGPYERRVVLKQGSTPINGPHQGGWVDTGRGQDWFIHFQDVNEYGRIPHLQPVKWVDDWPIMGINGEPVLEYAVPDTGFTSEMGLKMSDDFSGALKPEWQFQANPDAGRYALLKPGLRLHANDVPNPFEAAGFLSKLMQAFDFTMETRVSVKGDCAAGICMMGYDFNYIALENGKASLVSGTGIDMGRNRPAKSSTSIVEQITVSGAEAVLEMRVKQGKYSFYINGSPIGGVYKMSKGGWTGARPGIFCIGKAGFADFDGVRFTDESGKQI